MVFRIGFDSGAGWMPKTESTNLEFKIDISSEASNGVVNSDTLVSKPGPRKPGLSLS